MNSDLPVDPNATPTQSTRDESYVAGHEPPLAQPKRRALPTFEELYTVIGCVVVELE